MKRKYFTIVLLFFFIGIIKGSYTLREAYLDVMKNSILDLIYQGPAINGPFNYELRKIGREFPLQATTMIGLTGLNNIQHCCEDVIKYNIPGDFIETGVWRGGATIFMRAILKAYDIKNRIVWVADSFQGFPKPDISKYPSEVPPNNPMYSLPFLAISMDEVVENFKRYDLLDSQVKFLKGWFKDTLPKAPISKISVLRLDGDLYESTMDTLVNLYPKLSVGGYIIIDDYGAIKACRKAVYDFRTQNNITDPIITVDWTRVFWKKTE